MTLYTTPRSANGVKPLALVHHLRLDVAIEQIDVYAGQGATAGYRAVHPLGKVPALIDGDLVLWESNAILQYLAEGPGGGALWAPEPAGRADIARWMFWEAAHWQPTLIAALTPYVAHRLGLGPAPAAIDWDGLAHDRIVAALEAHLSTREYLAQGRLSVADLSVAAMWIYAADAGPPAGLLPAITRWYARVAALPAWTGALRGGPWAPGAR